MADKNGGRVGHFHKAAESMDAHNKSGRRFLLFSSGGYFRFTRKMTELIGQKLFLNCGARSTPQK
jgi:hypothetical protein